ncbi:MAG: acetyl-CoA carboxylase, biotin carboxyl carrier protein [Pirellulaceae bacterium]|nr:MAG: acetyl-CoA carboxylase, biotin carboxyl carrier protein [Pirellulaceae bacterium]
MAKAAGGGSRGRSDVFNVDRIRELIDLMEERGLVEVDLKRSDEQIRLVRGGQAAAPMAAAPAPPAAALPVAAESPAAPAPAAPAGDPPYIKVIRSPMVGTFYSKPNPTADDFVKVGSKVTPDTVVCIVEAMKVFNEIPAEVQGTIVEILASNEEAVDFDRPLFKVDTRG